MEETQIYKSRFLNNEDLEIRCIDFQSVEYPERLKQLPNMPKKLYIRGNLPDDSMPSIAIVGARASSPYGRIQAFHYAKFLSDAGIQVISGLAYGIDSEAHKGALEGKTSTWAVLGNGVDVTYPKSNRNLYTRIPSGGGGLLSEYAPGTAPYPGFFPARNRIISALADVVLIVEAKENSGSLITAGYALEQGRSVYALPGPVNEPLSQGCHKLIYDGAGIAYSPEILLQEWGIAPPKELKQRGKGNLGLARELELVYSYLDLRPKNPDFLARKTGLGIEQISKILVELVLLGHVEEVGRRYYIRR